MLKGSTALVLSKEGLEILSAHARRLEMGLEISEIDLGMYEVRPVYRDEADLARLTPLFSVGVAEALYEKLSHRRRY